MITDKEIQKYWNRYDWFIIRWNVVSLFFILSVVSFFFSFGVLLAGKDSWIWFLLYGLTVPFNILLKYGFGVKGLWLFNDTVDGDFGDTEEIRKAGHEDKSKLFIVIWWWFRNHSWNFNRKFIPEWDNGNYEEFRVIKQELPTGAHKFTWCSKVGIHGINYVAYRVNGKVEVRYSKANDKKEKQFGSGGNEYRFRIKF